MTTNEIDALKEVDQALSGIDDEARLRVLKWACDKYGATAQKTAGNSSFGSIGKGPIGTGEDTGEIAGIACLSSDGVFQLTVIDLKAKNTNDAAVRLAHVVALAHEQLTREPNVSSRKVLTPIMKEWRAYTPNTRHVLKKHKGILRNGDLISLDAHSKRDAEKFVKEILDDSIQGAWKP